jgi:hypothetical protein
VDWTFVYLMFALKVPIVAAIWLVWWAVKQEPDPYADERDDGGNQRRRPHPRRPFPRRPRRGPHGDPALPLTAPCAHDGGARPLPRPLGLPDLRA